LPYSPFFIYFSLSISISEGVAINFATPRLGAFVLANLPINCNVTSRDL